MQVWRAGIQKSSVAVAVRVPFLILETEKNKEGDGEGVPKWTWCRRLLVSQCSLRRASLCCQSDCSEVGSTWACPFCKVLWDTGFVIDWRTRQFSQCDTKIPTAALHISSSGWNRGSLRTPSFVKLQHTTDSGYNIWFHFNRHNLCLRSESDVSRQYSRTSSCFASQMSQDPIEQSRLQFVHVPQQLMWTQGCWSLSHLWGRRRSAPRTSRQPITGPTQSDKQAPTISHLHLLTIWSCQSTKDTRPWDCGRKSENTERPRRPQQKRVLFGI